MRVFPICSALIVLALSSCKDSYWDIASEPEMLSRIDGFISDMADIYERFPSENQEITEIPDELLLFYRSNSRGSNALLVNRANLKYIDSRAGFRVDDDDTFDIGWEYKLTRTLSERHNGQVEAPDDYRERLEEILNLRFIVAAQIDYEKPVIDEKNRIYIGGSVLADVAIYDRKTEKWLGRFSVEANSPERIDFGINHKWKFSEDRLSELRISMNVDLGKKIREQLDPLLDKNTLSVPAEEAEPNP